MKQRQKDAVKYYCTGETRGNWSASLRLAGYSDNYSKVGGYKLLEKDSIQKAIAEEKNRIDVKDEISIEVVRGNFLEDRQLAKDKGNVSNMVRADENLARHCGFYKEDNAKEKPVEQFTLNDIKILIEKNKGPDLPPDLGIAGHQTGHIKPVEVQTLEEGNPLEDI